MQPPGFLAKQFKLVWEQAGWHTCMVSSASIGPAAILLWESTGSFLSMWSVAAPIDLLRLRPLLEVASVWGGWSTQGLLFAALEVRFGSGITAIPNPASCLCLLPLSLTCSLPAPTPYLLFACPRMLPPASWKSQCNSPLLLIHRGCPTPGALIYGHLTCR